MISRAGWWTWIPSATPLQPQIEVLIFGLCSTSDDGPGWSMDSNPIHHLSSAKEWNAHFWITFTSGDQPGWLMDSNPICHPSPTKKMKCLLLYYVIVQIISRAGRWTQSPSTTPQAKKWNVNFCIMFNFWWLAGLVDGLEPHPLPFSSQKNEMLIFALHSTSDDWPGWSLDSNPIHLLSQAKKNEMLIFGLCSTSDDWPGWSMDSNPICHLSPAKEWNANFGLCSTSDDQLGWSMDSNPICYPSPNKKMICSFSEHAQLLMIGQAGQWTQTPSATSLQPKIWNVCFRITFNFWWSARLVEGLEPHLQPLSNQKNEMLIFVLCSTSGNQPGWSMDSNPICHPSPTKKMKCLFLDYFQFLVIIQAGWWTRTPSTTPLQPKNECSFLDYIQLLMIGGAGQ